MQIALLSDFSTKQMSAMSISQSDVSNLNIASSELDANICGAVLLCTVIFCLF